MFNYFRFVKLCATDVMYEYRTRHDPENTINQAKFKLQDETGGWATDLQAKVPLSLSLVIMLLFRATHHYSLMRLTSCFYWNYLLSRAESSALLKELSSDIVLAEEINGIAHDN